MRPLWIASMLLIVGATSVPADAAPGDGGILGKRSKTGSQLGVIDRREMTALAAKYGRRSSTGPWWDFGTASVCGGEPGSSSSDNQCTRFNLLCQGNDPAAGLGPPIAIWLRQTDRDGAPLPGSLWQKQGDTCFPELVPGARRALTMAMIQTAFHDTDFTVPTVNIQPEGDVTLVNLPTFFEVRFPKAGFGPDEVDTPDPARLLGYHIEVRPRLKSVTYHLGTTTVGPTTSLGGPHPTGDIRATYTQPGTHRVRADIVYTGQFRVGGGQWFDIPGQVDLEGTPVTLTVREARSRLYTH
jgi:hypothetical protein